MKPGGGASQPPAEAQRRAWIRQWRSAAVALDRVRYEDLQCGDMGRVAQELEGLHQASRVRESITGHVRARRARAMMPNASCRSLRLQVRR